MIRGPLTRLLFFSLVIPFFAHADEVALEVPESVPAGSQFEVSQSPIEPAGRISFVAEDGSPLEKINRYGYTNTKTGKTKLTAPFEPGRYGISFRAQGGEPQGLVAIEVTPVTATISPPESVDIGESFSVPFEGPLYGSATIIVATAEGEMIKNSGRAYPGNSKDGTVQLRAPMEPGDYKILFRMSDIVLAEKPIKVGGVTASLEAPETVQAGSEFVIRWEGPDNNGDTISLNDSAGVRKSGFAYAGNSENGLVRLTVPETLGEYTLVYTSGGVVLASRPLEVIAVSASLEAPAEVVAGELFEVEWEGPGNSRDTIRLVPPGDREAPTRAYTYLDPESSTADLPAIDEPGDYELVYRTRSGAILADRPLTIVPAPEKPGMLKVEATPGAAFGKNSAVEVILDASGSMLQRQDGKRRIDIAKETLAALLTETIPAGTPFALRVFGHIEPDSCRTDLEIPVSPLDPAEAASLISGIEAMNLAKTPIAASLSAVSSDLAGVAGERVVILLTDGEETCGGDPALAIRGLRAGGADVRVNIVGYAIEEESLRQTFESWAVLGNGQYLNAPTAGELADSMKKALAVPYRIHRGEEVVAEGIAGGPAHSLAPGDYTIRFRRDGEEKSAAASVVAEKSVTLSIP